MSEYSILRPKLDPVFKALFRNNQPLLKAMLEALLDYPEGSIQYLEILSPEIAPDKADNKTGFMDMKIKVDDTIVNVEIQLHTQDSYRERALFYWAKAYVDDFHRGQDFSELKQTISINIVDFPIFGKDNRKVSSTFALLETTDHEMLTDKCIFKFFVLPRLDRVVDKSDKKKLWLQFLNAETKEELDMLEQTKVPEIKNAVIKLHEFSADEIHREEIRLYEKALSDHASTIGTARREGIKVGIVKGRSEEREEIITLLRESGMSDEEIKRRLKL